MSKCSGCGLLYRYPEPKGQTEGFCLYYQLQLSQDDVWMDRECKDFFLRAPTESAFSHYRIKTSRDNLGDAYRESRRSTFVAMVSLGMSVGTFLTRFF